MPRFFVVVIALAIWSNASGQTETSPPEYPKYITIDKKYEHLARYFTEIFTITDDIIPFFKNGKWGLLQKTTLKVIVKPVFDYTDFRTSRGLDFGYDKKDFRLKNDKEVVGLVEEIIPKIEIRSPEPIVNDYKGFWPSPYETAERHSKIYLSVDVVPRKRGDTDRFGIATDKNGLKGVINTSGDTVSGLGFQYSELVWITDGFEKQYFIGKKKGQGQYYVYKLTGEIAFAQPFDNYKSFEHSQVVRGSLSNYIGLPSELYDAVYINGKWNLLDRTIHELAFKKGYDDIIAINGPTTANDRREIIGNAGAFPRYFLVKEGSEIFYVDIWGNEYLPKK